MDKFKNWRTSIAGLAGALLINVVPMLYGDWTIEKLVIGIVVAVLGFLAKDWNVTGLSGINAQSKGEVEQEIKEAKQ